MADLSYITARELPPKNHNNPPSELEMLGESLTLRNVHAMRAAEEHIGVVAQMPDHFEEENEAAYTADLIKLMQNLIKEMERRRKEEKEPFLRQGQYVDSFFGDYTAKLEASIAAAKRPLDDWLNRKARAEREERDALAKTLREQQAAALREVKNPSPAGTAEERNHAVEKAIEITQQVRVADALAAQPLNTLARTAGNASSAALVPKWVGTIKDVEQLDLHKLRPYIAAAELQKALDRFVKQGGRQCDGAEIKEVIQAKVK